MCWQEIHVLVLNGLNGQFQRFWPNKKIGKVTIPLCDRLLATCSFESDLGSVNCDINAKKNFLAWNWGKHCFLSLYWVYLHHAEVTEYIMVLFVVLFVVVTLYTAPCIWKFILHFVAHRKFRGVLSKSDYLWKLKSVGFFCYHSICHVSSWGVNQQGKNPKLQMLQANLRTFLLTKHLSLVVNIIYCSMLCTCMSDYHCVVTVECTSFLLWTHYFCVILGA